MQRETIASSMSYECIKVLALDRQIHAALAPS